MNCAFCEEHLSDYLEDSLGLADRVAMENHLQFCDLCRELMEGVQSVILVGNALPVETPPAWLADRIIANTPQVVRLTWRDSIRAAWTQFCEPRFALGLLTSTLVLGWMGSVAGISAPDPSMLRHPSAIYYGIEGWANRVYGDAVRNYYSSPLVNAIQCQIHTRIEQFRENS